MPIDYCLGLGSNQGNRRQNLLLGLRLLRRHGSIRSISSVYITKPVDIPCACSNFFNMAINFRSSLHPRRLLCLCKAIEKRCGRGIGSHNLPRPLDIDILLADSLQVSDADLHIPHEKITERLFVLLPLLEILEETPAESTRASLQEIAKTLSRKGILGRFRLSEHGVPNG